ncbi:MAG: DegV family protein [Anaerococcus vaginalis]|nr:DegV family protein [Anaerococcus vaginalis]
MKNVKIIADSGCNVDLDLANKYKIRILPFNIHFKDESYIDLVDISRKEFFEKYKESNEKVKTSTPSIGNFLEILQEEYYKGYRNFIGFSMTKKFSGMNQMMNLAKEIFSTDKEDVKIEIIDTDTATTASIYPIIKAAKLSNEGYDFDYIVEKSKESLKYCNVSGVVNNFDALSRGGRLPKTIAKLANLISFSPILCIEDGEIKIIKKVKGKKKSYKLFIEYLKDLCKKYPSYHLIIGGGDSEKEIEILKEGLKEEIEKAEKFDVIDITPVIGVHLGNGVIVCSVFPAD